jgi:hypothetical protein
MRNPSYATLSMHALHCSTHHHQWQHNNNPCECAPVDIRTSRPVRRRLRSQQEKKSQSTIKAFHPVRSRALTRPALPRVGKYSVPSGGEVCCWPSPSCCAHTCTVDSLMIRTAHRYYRDTHLVVLTYHMIPCQQQQQSHIQSNLPKPSQKDLDLSLGSPRSSKHSSSK